MQRQRSSCTQADNGIEAVSEPPKQILGQRRDEQLGSDPKCAIVGKFLGGMLSHSQLLELGEQEQRRCKLDARARQQVQRHQSHGFKAIGDELRTMRSLERRQQACWTASRQTLKQGSMYEYQSHGIRATSDKLRTMRSFQAKTASWTLKQGSRCNEVMASKPRVMRSAPYAAFKSKDSSKLDSQARQQVQRVMSSGPCAAFESKDKACGKRMPTATEWKDIYSHQASGIAIPGTKTSWIVQVAPHLRKYQQEPKMA
ncbi:MAG: hypothetical protein Q9212_005514 [Teloschistes hypoglaucus]